jgi:hypothetical protein
MQEHSPYSYKVRSPHRMILVLFALVVNFLLYLAFSSNMVGMQPDHAAELGALVAFLLIALVSYAFKGFLEE